MARPCKVCSRLELSGKRSTFGNLRCRLRGRRSILFSWASECVAGAALCAEGEPRIANRTGVDAQISRQAQHFRKLACRFRGRRNTLASSSTDFVAGAALSQARVQTPRQAQHFRKLKWPKGAWHVCFSLGACPF